MPEPSTSETPRHRRPTVVFVDHCARDSGAELTLLALARSMHRYRPVVLLGENGPLVGRLAEAGVDTRVVPLPDRTRDASRNAVGSLALLPAQVLDVVRYAWVLRREIRWERPVLVHTHSMKSHVFGGLAAWLARRPRLLHVHDRISTVFMSAAGVQLMRLVLRVLATGVVTNSGATEATVPARVRGRRPSLVLPSPVTDPGVTAEQTRAAADGLTFVMVGRITPWKGQDLVLRGFAQAFGAGSAGERHRLLIVGAPQFGEDDYLAELKDLVGELGLGARVDFTGHVLDVYGLLCTAQVLVHGSVIPEPFGMVVAQGLAAGLAVVASGEGGPAEMITSGADGLLFQPRNVDSLAESLQLVAADDALRRRLAARAPHTASAFLEEPVTARLEEFYDAVLAARR
ncbi:glycosyltransferase [Spongisporangium articulatum]|uniref:Glycosyltransferase n=1 Tax=Spongisporangium articulatum TaxID=3362603 RepID=A0ABW8AT44_9ACTN